ncbi:TPA: hypothetical protein ACPZND_003023 [Yersinia enterocolitica]
MFNQIKYLTDIKKIVGNYPKYKNKRNAFIRLRRALDNIEPRYVRGFSIACSKNVQIREIINLGFFKRDIFIDLLPERKVPIDFILSSFYGFYSSNIDIFNVIEKNMEELEKLVILEKFDDAIKLLDFIDLKYGGSIWSLDARMAITGKYKTSEDVKKINIKGKHRLAHISSLLQQKHLSRGALAFQQQILNHTVSELKSKNFNSFSEFLLLILLPYNLNNRVKIDDVIIFSQKLYPIDKLFIIKKAISSYISSSRKSDLNDSVYHDFIHSMSKVSKDQSWINIKKLINSEPTVRINEDIKSIINVYSKGDYLTTVNLCDVFISRYPTELSVIDIYSKALFYLSNSAVDKVNKKERKTLVETLIHSQFMLYVSTNNYEKVKENIDLLSFKFSNLNFTHSICAMFYAAYPFINEIELRRYCRLLSCGYTFITPKYNAKLMLSDRELNSFEHDHIDEIELSDSRKIRLYIESEIKSDSPDSIKIDNLLSKLENMHDVTIAELNQIKAIAYIKLCQFDLLIKEINKVCNININDMMLFPAHYIAEVINSQSENISNKLNAAIFSYLYYINIDKSYKETTADYLEDYLLVNNVKVPSELIANLPNLYEHEMFFDKVCNQQILGSILELNSSKLTMLERLKIISLLHEKFDYTSESLESEEKEIFNFLLVNNIKEHHESNKIMIDSEGLKGAKYLEYKSFYENLSEVTLFNTNLLTKYFPDEENDEEEINDSSTIDQEINDSILIEDEDINSEISILYFYGNFYSKVINDFIMDHDYGLIRYLSSEIRHGVMPNQMRSVFESLSLVTEKGISGKYSSNEYWAKTYLDKLPILDVEYIQNQLDWFCGGVDELINKANSWTKPVTVWSEVALGNKDDKSSFYFIIDDDKTYEFYLAIKETIDYKSHEATSDDDINRMFNACENFIWIQLDQCFANIKERFNLNLKDGFNKLCTDFIEKLAILPISSKPQKLIDNIKTAQYEIIEKVANIEGWFKRPQGIMDEKYRVIDVVNASIDCVKGIYDPQVLTINLSIDEIVNNNELSNKQSLYLTRALVTSYINCFKHGANRAKTDVFLKVTEDDYCYSIIIKNEINEETKKRIVDNGIIKEVENYDSEHYTEKLITEGGTGLYKVYRNIKDGFGVAEFSIAQENLSFVQSIGFTLD